MERNFLLSVVFILSLYPKVPREYADFLINKKIKVFEANILNQQAIDPANDGIDEFLLKLAALHKKKVEFLETVEEQIGYLRTVTLEKQQERIKAFQSEIKSKAQALGYDLNKIPNSQFRVDDRLTAILVEANKGQVDAYKKSIDIQTPTLL